MAAPGYFPGKLNGKRPGKVDRAVFRRETADRIDSREESVSVVWREHAGSWNAVSMARGNAPYHVLFLCTGNSARSILAECVLNRNGAGRYRAFSAGSRPKSAPHPAAIALLREEGFETGDLRSKSWDEFAVADAPHIDLVVTVCDNARGEACPVWPGHPVTTHWGVEDPAATEFPPAAQRKAFRAAWDALGARIEAFLALPLAQVDPEAWQRQLDQIGDRGGF